MNTLYNCGVKGKLYRLWYELYKDSQIKVKTAGGMTDIKPTGENVTQGSIGGAILSSANLDNTLGAYFGGSDSELSYGDRRLRPITFQDDTSRLVGSLEDAQRGNVIMEAAMKRMQLDLNVSKCSVIVFGKKKRVETIRNQINNQKKLKIGEKIIEAKQKDDYLGDTIHEEGLEKSAEATIMKRYGRTLSSIIEVSAILDDFRIDTVGGLKAGLDIFELALLPSVLNNSEIWLELGKTSIQKLDNIQNMMYRNLFGVPAATPTRLLRFDLCGLTMEERIHKKKLSFLHHLTTLRESESLAGDIFQLQAKYEFPGLVTECKLLMNYYNLPNIIDESVQFSKQQWKQMLKTEINKKSQENIKKEFANYSKLKNKDFETEQLKVKDYILNMKLRDARTYFRMRTNMLNTKMNRKHDPNYAMKLWKCDECMSMDSQAHIIWCPAYAPLREGKDLKNDLDLVHYYQQVMKIREDSNTT